MDVPAIAWCQAETALDLDGAFLAAPGLLRLEAKNARLSAGLVFGRKASEVSGMSGGMKTKGG